MNFFQRASPFAFVVSFLVVSTVGFAQAGRNATPSRIVSAVDNSNVVRLQGNVHPLARPEFDRGSVDPQMPMTHMLLLLQRSAAQESALERYMAQQSDRSSSNYHQWLSPAEFGQKYGPSDADVAQVTGWLQSQGLSVDHVSNGRVTVEFSGPAAQVQTAFHTQIHNYLVRGVTHYANVSDPAIPQALAPVVAGVASLNDFSAKPQSIAGRYVRRDPRTGAITPVDGDQASADFTRVNSSGNTIEDLTPADFATIYNVQPLWNANINGSGQTIAIAGESDINLADIATFQSSFGMANKPPSVIYPDGNPGTNSNEQEQELDVEWSDAVAPGATIQLVVIGSTKTTSGFQLAAQYVIDNRTATILSESYGQCEQSLGTTGNATYNALWQQGAAEGISIFGSAGDQGSAGCENSDLYAYNPATTGLNVNGIASSPYITAVGGTDFNWQNSPLSTYWSSTNAANNSTALGYIPEIPWNATCTSAYLVGYFGAANAEANCNALAATTSTMSNLVYITGGSGGASACTTVSKSGTCSGGYAKPSWQSGTGVPTDGVRDVPDVSLFAGSGIPDGIAGSSYLICYSGTYACSYGNSTDVVYQEIGGTSVSSPAMAGVMALVQQKMGSAQGLANPVLYQLAAAESNLTACDTNAVTAGNNCVFYDTTIGSNAMPCKSGSTNCVVNVTGDTVGVLSGYSATTGYDQATGLGSVNAANLVNAWATVPSPTINFAIANQTYSTTTVSLGATSNSPGTFGYSVVSGPATISGSTLTMTGAGAVTVLAYQTAAGGYTGGSATASFAISPIATSVSWSPSATTLFGGTALGTGILDAKGSVAGSLVYTAVLGSAAPITVTSTSTLANVGVYAITATLTPTNSGYSSSTATINLTVTSAYIWAVNPSGSISEFYGNAAVTSSAVAGGGVGAAVDNGGNLWTLNAGGNSLAEFNSNATLVQSGISGGGISGATGLAIDGNGSIWLVNSNNSVSVVSKGAATSPSTGYTGGNLSSPSGVAIDISGNVWVSNAGNNSVTELLGAAAPVAPTAIAIKSNTLGARP